MSKRFKFFFDARALFTIIFIVGCSPENPKSVAEHFLKAAAEMNYQEAKKYATPLTGKLLDMRAGAEAYIPDSVKKSMISNFTVLNEYSRTDTSAVVLYHVKNFDTDQVLNLVKRDGKWLVNVSKEELNSWEAEPPVEVEEDHLDSLATEVK